MSNEVVYVLGSPGSNTVKIGRTSNLTRRIGDIQRMSPIRLEVLWSHPGGSELEGNLHRFFAELRSHGEWFTFRDDPVEAVSQAVRNNEWPEPRRPAPKPVSGTNRATRRQVPLPRARQVMRPTQILPPGFRDGLTCAFVAASEDLTASDIKKMVDMVVPDLERRLRELHKRLGSDGPLQMSA